MQNSIGGVLSSVSTLLLLLLLLFTLVLKILGLKTKVKGIIILFLRPQVQSSQAKILNTISMFGINIIIINSIIIIRDTTNT